MSQYNFKISYRKRSENAKADALSQREDYLRDKPKVRNTILQQNQFGNIEYNRQLIAVILQTKNDDFKKKIREAFSKDRIAQDILKNLKDKNNFDEQNEILTY